jgi:hypothetical protein
MRAYAMCLLDGRTSFPVQRTEFVAVDDEAAIVHALAFCQSHLVEVLSGERVIARIPKGAVNVEATERASPGSTERIL